MASAALNVHRPVINGAEMYWPKFENTLLENLAFSLRKRHKALKHKVGKLDCERIIELADGQRVEKMELALHPLASGHSVCLRVFAWEDRWIWLDARAATKRGWAWEWTYEGRLLGEYSGREIVEGIETTLTSILGIESRGTGELTDVWAGLLAQGPKAIHSH